MTETDLDRDWLLLKYHFYVQHHYYRVRPCHKLGEVARRSSWVTESPPMPYKYTGTAPEGSAGLVMLQDVPKVS